MSFSIVLKRLREENHLSQKQIAEYLRITRQAVAAYELGKREPDYNTLKSLAEYFRVSVDYFLGRTDCREGESITVGKNIELIRGAMAYSQMSQEIGKRTGVLIFSEMIEIYEKGERLPVSATLKVFSKYAGVRDSFFFQHNTIESYQKEREIYKLEVLQEIAADSRTTNKYLPNFLDLDSIQWMTNERNLPFIRLAMEIQQSGLTANVLKPLIESFREKQN